MLLLLITLLLLLDPVYMFCPYGCGCDEENSIVTCIRANLEVMPISLNPGIRTLILKYNDFTTVDASFNFYPKLELVDLSHNGIASIPSRGFKSQRDLRDLRLNDNKISQLEHDTFHGLRKLQSLELRRNFLSRIPSHLFSELSSLEVLDLGANRIAEIQPAALAFLKELRILRLNNNNLDSIPQGLGELNNLVELDLSRNKIRTMPENSVLPRSLAMLDLSHNSISSIPVRSLDRLGNLQTLNVQNNALASIPTDAFKHLESLKQLFIGQNRFATVPQNSFSGMTSLTTLDISGSTDLVEVQESAFAENEQLTKLTIASNKNLRSIHPKAFAGIPNLLHVDISGNAVEHMPSSLLPWHRLVSLQVSGNPLNCDCTNYFLRDVIHALVNNSETIRVVRCWTPLHLRDADLALLQLNCDVTSSSRSQEDDILMAVVVSIVGSILLIISIVLLSVLFKRTRRKSGRTQLPVKDTDILQYEDSEPRYVSDYIVRTNVVSNPYHENIVRSSEYFTQKHEFVGDPMVYRTVNMTDHNVVYSDPTRELERFVKMKPSCLYEDPISSL